MNTAASLSIKNNNVLIFSNFQITDYAKSNSNQNSSATS